MAMLSPLPRSAALANVLIVQLLLAGHTLAAGTTPSTTTLNALSPAGTVAYGSTRTYSGAVTPAAATGSVQVLAGTTVICTATLTGTTSKTYSCTSATVPSPGTYSVTGKYLGDTTYNVSTSAALSQTISKANPSSVALASSTATPTQSTAFTLTATVTVPTGTTPTGTVNFRNSANTSLTGCSAVALAGTGVAKTATCTVTETTAGAKTYNALYSGDTNFNAGSNPTVSVTVANTTTATSLALAASATSLTYPAQPSLTATLTPNTVNVGTVSFKRGTVDIAGCLNLALPATPTPPITITCTPGIADAGSYVYTASYGGGTGTGSTAGITFSASSGSSPAVTLAKASPSAITLSSSTATPMQATPFTLTVTVTGPTGTSPSGSINFRDSANASLTGCSAVALGGTGASKTATCSVTEAAIANKTYNALYSGDTNFTAGSNPSISVSVISNIPANNNTGNNSAANPVQIDVFYVHPDHLGTPRAVTNPATNLKVWEWESTPFGETQANENPQNLTGTALTTGQFRYNLRFPGQFFDAESGKYYNYFRDYDPSIGRYIESDPIGLDGGVNTFAYVTGNPIGLIDPSGLKTLPPPVKIVCKLLPKVCDQLKKCVAHPLECSGLCSTPSHFLYHPLCDQPGCVGGEHQATLQFKLLAAESCLFLREFVKARCFQGKPNPSHDAEIEKARAKVRKCLECNPGKCGS